MKLLVTRISAGIVFCGALSLFSGCSTTEREPAAAPADSAEDGHQHSDGDHEHSDHEHADHEHSDHKHGDAEHPETDHEHTDSEK